MNITKTKIVALGSTAAVGLGIAITAASGAYFSASEPIQVSGNTGTLSVAVNGSSTDTAALNFANIVPGSTVKQTFTVTNTGTVAADVSIGQPITPKGLHIGDPALPGSGQLDLLSVGVENHTPMTPITATSIPIDLGVLAPNQTVSYTVDVTLDPNATDVWQGTSASGLVTVTLNQVH